MNWNNSILHHRGWLFLAVFFALASRSFAQKSAHWRTFKVGDGYAAAVSVGPKGNVWVRNGDSPEVDWLDGYAVHRLAAPDVSHFRVYESRSGQLWSIYAEGLLLFEYGQWSRHPVKEIQAELQSNLLRQVALVPAEINHAFFLLSDRFMEYDAAVKKARVLKWAGETKLGKFSEMQEAHDGSVWISGFNGLAKLPGPVRRLNSETVWQEFPLQSTGPAEKLQRPFADAFGGVTTVAFDRSVSSRRYLAHFDGRNWITMPVEEEKIRQAWRAWDQTVWAYAFNSLLRFESLSRSGYMKETVAGAQYDMALETNGVFWIATSEGAIRYAPLLWQVPPALADGPAPVHAFLRETDPDQEHFWFAGTDALVESRAGNLRHHKWPEDFEPYASSTDALYKLRDGRIAVAASARSLLFNPRTDQFQNIQHPLGRRFKFIGQFKHGSLCAKTSDLGNPNAYELEMFDGLAFRPFLESPANWNLGSDLYFLKVIQNGDMWFGGSAGVGVYRASDHQFATFGPSDGYSGDRAFCLLEVSDDKIWCGGLDRVLEFNGKKWRAVYSGCDRVNAMIKGRDGRIWIATNNGLYHYYNDSWVPNDTEEGLPSAAVHDLMEDAQGHIWAGTSRGLCRHHGEADPDPPRTLAPVVENAKSSTTAGATTIVFSGIDKWNYTPAARLLYSYRLDDAAWSPYSYEMTKVFQGLGAGQHRFELRAMDRNWNEDPNSAWVEFNVIMPWFQDPRLIGVSIFLLIIILLLAGLAVNRHVQLVRSYAEVEKIVAQRTRELELANQELFHTQKMKALGTLAAGIAHDFNNILSIIKGSAQIIEHNLGDSEKVRTRVDRIKTVVEQGMGIVRSMLGLGRVTEKEMNPCDLAEVLEETIKLVSDRFPQGIVFQLEKTSPRPVILCSREIVQQMLLNLLLNAADAMSGNGVVLLQTEILSAPPAKSVLPPAPAAQYIVLGVKDSGHGIPQEVLPRIFEPFFTTKSFSARRGTGLGLSMVYELAKGMGYGLAVTSVAGQGSTFAILIPVRASPNLNAEQNRL